MQGNYQSIPNPTCARLFYFRRPLRRAVYWVRVKRLLLVGCGLVARAGRRRTYVCGDGGSVGTGAWLPHQAH